MILIILGIADMVLALFNEGKLQKIGWVLLGMALILEGVAQIMIPDQTVLKVILVIIAATGFIIGTVGAIKTAK